jgi:hypothetical protein
MEPLLPVHLLALSTVRSAHLLPQRPLLARAQHDRSREAVSFRRCPLGGGKQPPEWFGKV